MQMIQGCCHNFVHNYHFVEHIHLYLYSRLEHYCKCSSSHVPSHNVGEVEEATKPEKQEQVKLPAVFTHSCS